MNKPVDPIALAEFNLCRQHMVNAAGRLMDGDANQMIVLLAQAFINSVLQIQDSLKP